VGADVEIIIVSYNTRAELDACLSSLAGAKPACLARIVVVDNASSDGSADMVRSRWPDVDLLPLVRNVGFGAANNLALRKCRHPYALLLNSDTVVPPGAVDKLRERMLARAAAAAGPRLVGETGRPEVSFGAMLTPFSELVQRWRVRVASRPGHWAAAGLARHLAGERFVDWVSGACMLLETQAAGAVGFFDERFFMYEEDVDLCASLRAAGGRVLFTTAAEIVHLRGRSQSAESGPVSFHYDRSHIAFYEKHAPGWAPWLRLWLRVQGRRLR
jgi:GT2 family glycosyltransferase